MATTDERILKALEKLGEKGKESGPSLGLDTNAKDFKKALDVSKDGLRSFADEAKSSLGTWRDLSKVGAGFSNDIIGMSTAAASSRMSLDDFAKVVKDNATNMTGLGGSVGRGAETFAKLSKSFFDSNLDRGLREIGYTSKELNDVLALTAGAQKSAFSEKAGTDKMAKEAAAGMAKEMDLISKLTGKSRAEQLEAMNKSKADGQVEAKLRLLTAGKGEEEAARIRNEYMTGLLESQKQGTEQAYKEFFATGTYLSEEAATQAALFGKQARAQEESIKAMQSGDFTKAAEARANSAAESLKNQSDKTLLTVATFGSAAGTAGDVMKKNIEVNDALYHSVATVKKEYEAQHGTMMSWSDALKETRSRIEKEQAGLDKEGKARSGATEGLIAIEKAQQDFRAGLAGAAEAVDKDGKGLANALRDTGTVVKNVIKDIEGYSTGGNIGKNIREKAEAGMQGDKAGGAVGGATKAASDVANKGIETGAKIAGELSGPNNPLGPMSGASGGTPLQKREVGGPVDAGTPYLVGEGGKAEIFVPKVAGDIVPMDKVGSTLPPPPDPKEQKSFAESMAASVKKGMQTVGVDPNMRGNPTGGMDGFDLSSVSKDIKTSISSVVGGGSSTTRSVQNEDSLAASKELQSVKEQMAAEKAALAAKFKEQMPEAGSRQLRNAINNSDESKELAAKYEALMKPLEKKIEEGIVWETTVKQSAIEETKERLNEQVKFAKEKAEEETTTAEETAERLKKINENRTKINEISTAVPTGTVPIVKQDQINKSTEVPPSEKVSLNKFKNLPGINFNQGMPPSDPKSNAADAGKGTTEAAAKLKKEEEAKIATEKAKKEKEQAAATAAGSKPSESGKPGPASQKTTSLDDVVKGLDRVNSTLGQLMSQQADLIRKQTTTMMSAGSSNVYDKTR
jgi:hypothetical protein